MRLFGTDGIRAPFGTPPLDRATVTHLGYCLAEVLATENRRSVVVMGGDTRESTPEICRWLATGLEAGRTRTIFGGVLPTPAVAKSVLVSAADAGISVSASHNLHPYNGIKLFDGHGYKWSPDAEAALEQLILSSQSRQLTDAAELTVDPTIAEMYLQHLADLVGRATSLAGMRIVLDTANGAATPFAKPLFESLGARVTVIGDRPDGQNINAGFGSTAPDAMLEAVKQTRAHLGVAFDGDADRALIADEQGVMHDGDAMLFAWAQYLHGRDELTPPSLVATSMSNLGLEKALQALGISVVRCDVGDRTVVSTMREKGIRLGGEQSGHLVDLATGTTGDGLATALQLSVILRGQGSPLSDLLADFRRFPQVLKNVRVVSKPDLNTLPEVARVAAEVVSTLGNQGRLVLRYSGTEPLARVMIEGPDQSQIESLADRLIAEIRSAVGADTDK